MEAASGLRKSLSNSKIMSTRYAGYGLIESWDNVLIDTARCRCNFWNDARKASLFHVKDICTA